MSKFCFNCGNKLDENADVCIHCGVKVKKDVVSNNSYDAGGIGWGLLGFLVPIVGLILYFVWKDEKPKTAKAVGKGALIYAILYAIIIVIISLFVFVFSLDKNRFNGWIKNEIFDLDDYYDYEYDYDFDYKFE